MDMAVIFGTQEVDGEDDQNNHDCKYCDILHLFQEWQSISTLCEPSLKWKKKKRWLAFLLTSNMHREPGHTP